MVVKDLRVLKKLALTFGIEYDKVHRYITNSGQIECGTDRKRLQKSGYDLKYFDGCFYPFIVIRKVKP